jgi:tetratricopeptide (TPR) repeat protein
VKKFIAILFFLFLALSPFAQSKYVDELKNQLTSVKGDSTRWLLLNKLFYEYLYSYSDSSIPYVQQEILLAKQMKSDLALSKSYIDYCAFFEIMGDYPQALHYTLEALKLGEKSKNWFVIARVYNDWAGIYSDQGDYQNSILYGMKAKSLMEKHWKPSFEKDLYTAGDCTGDTVANYLFILSGIEDTYEKSDQLDSATKYLQTCNNVVIKLTGKMDDASVLHRFGNIYLKKGDYTTALKCYHTGVSLATAHDVTLDIMKNCLGIANTYEKMGEFDSSIFYANKVVELSKLGYAFLIKLNALNLLADIYKSKHNADSVAKYFDLIIGTKDSLFSQKKMIQLQSITFDEQRRQQEQAQQQHELQSKIRFYSLLSALVILLLLAIIIIRNVILKRRSEKQRLEYKLELQQIESERKEESLKHKATELEMQALRAQMNPHFIFNSLNSINRFILQNNKTQASEYLTKFSRLVRLILQNSQAAFISLENELEALQLYLELEAVRFDHQFEYRIIVDKDIDTSVIKVPPLIIQPYAENAIWHGLMHLPGPQAGKEIKGLLEIKLFLEENTLFCKITDNGIGRRKAVELKSKSAASHKSMGLRITADRIARLQQNKVWVDYITVNDLEYADGSAAGTEVVLKIPLHNN